MAVFWAHGQYHETKAQSEEAMGAQNDAVAVIAAYMACNGVADESASSVAGCLFSALQEYQETGDLDVLAQYLGGSPLRNLDAYLTVAELMAQEELSERTAQRWAAALGEKATLGEAFTLIARKRVKRMPPSGILLFPKDQRAQLAARRKKKR